MGSSRLRVEGLGFGRCLTKLAPVETAGSLIAVWESDGGAALQSQKMQRLAGHELADQRKLPETAG